MLSLHLSRITVTLFIWSWPVVPHIFPAGPERLKRVRGTTPIIATLHWLPVNFGVAFKIFFSKFFLKP